MIYIYPGRIKDRNNIYEKLNLHILAKSEIEIGCQNIKNDLRTTNLRVWKIKSIIYNPLIYVSWQNIRNDFHSSKLPLNDDPTFDLEAHRAWNRFLRVQCPEPSSRFMIQGTRGIGHFTRQRLRLVARVGEFLSVSESAGNINIPWLNYTSDFYYLILQPEIVSGKRREKIFRHFVHAPWLFVSG